MESRGKREEGEERKGTREGGDEGGKGRSASERYLYLCQVLVEILFLTMMQVCR